MEVAGPAVPGGPERGDWRSGEAEKDVCCAAARAKSARTRWAVRWSWEREAGRGRLQEGSRACTCRKTGAGMLRDT